MSLGNTAARGAGVVLGTQAARALLQFGSVVLLTRLLTPRDIGLVAMVTAVIGLAEIIRDAGLSSAAVQATTLSEDERTNLFWANLGLGTACAVAAAASAPLLVAGYREPELAPIVLALAGVFVISGANTQYRSDLTRRMKYRQLAASDVVAQLLAITIAISLALAGAGLWAIVAQQITTAVVALVINVVNVRWRPGLYRRGVSLSRFFRFGGGVLGTHALAYLTKTISSVALGAMWGAASLGFYNRAYQLLMTPLQQIDAPITGVALPVLSRVADDEPTFTRYVAKVQLVACYVTGPVLAVAAGLASPLVLVLFGLKWIAIVPIFAVLAVGGIFRSLGTVAYWIFLAKGHTGAQLRQDLIARPIMIGLMLAGLPWGPFGVAVGHSVAFFFYWVLAYVNVGRVTRMDVRPLFVPAVRSVLVVSTPAGLAAAAVSAALSLAPVLELVLGAGAAAAWLALAAAVIPSVRADFRQAYALGRRAVRRP